jgi:hypothetical protein
VNIIDERIKFLNGEVVQVMIVQFEGFHFEKGVSCKTNDTFPSQNQQQLSCFSVFLYLAHHNKESFSFKKLEKNVFGEKPSRKTNHKVFALKRTISRMKHLQESQEIGTEDVEKLKKVRSRQNRTPI